MIQIHQIRRKNQVHQIMDLIRVHHRTVDIVNRIIPAQQVIHMQAVQHMTIINKVIINKVHMVMVISGEVMEVHIRN
jgi:hypothetical protein